MGNRALVSTAMNVLHAVILAVLAIVQVVLADRQARKLHTWTPNDCTPETFKSYPVGKRRYAASLHQCNGLTFVKNKGKTNKRKTKLKVYDQQRKRWKRVKMPRKLKKVSNYSVTCWDSNLLVVGGESIWSLDGASLAQEGKFDWQKLNISLENPAAVRCAVVSKGDPLNSEGDLLTVMSGNIDPHDMVTEVYIYNLNTGQVTPGKNIMSRIEDCKDVARPEVDPRVIAIGRNGSALVQAFDINQFTGNNGQGPSIDPIGPSAPFRIMILHQMENWLTVVGGDPTYVYVYDLKTREWKREEKVPAPGSVLGVIEGGEVITRSNLLSPLDWV